MSEEKTLVIPSEPIRVEEVDQYLEKIVSELPFSRDERDDIAIAVSEAVNNAIVHGNNSDPDKSVTIRFTFLDNGLRVMVSDNGKGFNLSEVANPTDPDKIMALAGRGLLIIRHLMDEVDVQPLPTGTKITMTKFFPAD